MDRRTSALQRFQVPILISLFTALLVGALAAEWLSLRRLAVFDAKSRAQTLTEVFQSSMGGEMPLWRLLEQLEEPQSYQRLDQLARHNLQALSLAKIKVYDARGLLVFSDDPAQVGQDHSGKPILAQAIAGQTVSKIVQPKAYQDLYGTDQFSSLVETYTPVTDEQGRVKHVLEVYQDFDAAAARIRQGTLRVAGQLAVLVVAAFASVVWLTRRIHRLEHEVGLLETLLPICSHCKNIRTEVSGEEKWVPVDRYFREQKQAEFSHGICDECLSRHYPELGGAPGRGAETGS